MFYTKLQQAARDALQSLLQVSEHGLVNPCAASHNAAQGSRAAIGHSRSPSSGLLPNNISSRAQATDDKVSWKGP